MADTNLDPSIISVTNRAVAVASTASPRELLNISRIGPSLEQSENANLEITLNARAEDLAPTATANELRSLGMAIGNMLEPQTERIFMDWRHGFIPDQRFANGQFLRTAGSHQKSWGGVTTTTLDELELTSVATGESLVYNSVSGKFENSTNTFAITVYAAEADLPTLTIAGRGSLAYVTETSEVYYFDGSFWTIVQDVFSGIYRGNWTQFSQSNDHNFQRSHAPTDSSTTTFVVDGTEATAGTATSSISLVWDNAVANATNLASLHSAEGAQASENYIVLADGTKNPNIKAFDRSTLTELWSYDDDSFSDGINAVWNLAVTDNYVAFVNIRGHGNQGEVNILDITTGNRIATINSGAAGGHMMGIFTLPNGKLVTYGRFAPTYLQQYDMTDPANPVQEWQISTAPTQYQYAGFASEYGEVAGNNSLIAVNANGDPWDGGSTVDNNNPAKRSNGRVYLVDTSDGSVRSSVGDPNYPDANGTNSFRRVAGITSTNKLYVGAPNTDGDQGYEKSEGRIHVFDVSDPDNPSLIKSLAPADYGYSAPTGSNSWSRNFGTEDTRLVGDYLFANVATGPSGTEDILVIDTSDDSLVATLDTTSLGQYAGLPRDAGNAVILRIGPPWTNNFLLPAEEVAGPSIVGGSVDTTSRWTQFSQSNDHNFQNSHAPTDSTTSTAVIDVASISFDGDDYLTTEGRTFFSPENYAFTIDFWVYPETYGGFFQMYPQGSELSSIKTALTMGINTTGDWVVRTNENLDGDVVKTGGGYNQWYHVAIERLKNNNGSYDTYVYIDGVNVYHHYDPTNDPATNYGNYPSQTTTIVLGAWWNADYALTGKISQWRYIRGNSGSDTIYNVRDGSFAVPTTPSQQETNTLLLIGVQGQAGDTIVSETEHPVYTLTASGDPTYVEDDPFS